MRLAASSNLNGSTSAAEEGRHAEGRVEVCQDGVWSKVYGSSSWTNREASVVCRQLLGPDNIMGMLLMFSLFLLLFCSSFFLMCEF